MNYIASTFKEKKLKLTPQRLAVYKYLIGTNEHPSAEVIYKALQPEYPTMSLATVYKTLKTLTTESLIQEINVGEANFRYDANANEHAHVKCMNCSKVDDLHALSLPSLNDMAEKASNFKILSNKIFFYGICKDCQQ